MERNKSDARLFELVYFSIHDVGRAIPQSALAGAVAASAARRSGLPVSVRRDTPASLSLPRPVVLPLDGADSEGFGRLRAEAKIYDDGAITICVRARERLRLMDLGRATNTPIVRSGLRALTMEAWVEELFTGVLKIVGPMIVDPLPEDRRDREAYLAYCLLDCPEGADHYLEKNRKDIAALLVVADPGAELHEQQIGSALGKPFSYLSDDYAVFDQDRCFIIDPRGDYEDVLLIAEHANYRLLELRSLDRLLDQRLEEAEKDLIAYEHSSRRHGSAPRAKFARIQALRFEALFVLENLENSAKIIGDYYLGQIYDRLCAILNTDGWSRSVERRLDVLESVYDMAKTDTSDRRMLVLEVVFIVVCVVLPVIQIWQALL